MRYTLVPEHHHYFEEHGSLLLEGLIDPFILGDEPQRDLFREDAQMEKIAKSKKLADIAASLMGVTPLRLLYDEVITESSASLEEISPYQGVVGGWLLEPQGDGTFFSKSMPLEVLEGPRLLIVYGKGSTVYTPNVKGPLLPRALGYHHGDRLADATHPIVLSFSSRSH